MANYQSLKTAINAVIKANGNKEITGTVLNEVLLAMVNSLGVGYQFAGVATPSTNPGTPDQKVFYIASQAGTYTNFNGAVVSDGIAIFKWNGTWTTEMLDLSMAGQVQSDWTETDTTKKSYIKHKPNIPPSANVDPKPTNGSPNAVASGGVYNALKAITDFLTNGYYFVGIAGTSTEPDTVTQYGIFYIASDGGTYTNFLNGDDEPLTLYQGLNILYKNVEDDGWNYFEVFKFSDFVDTTQQQSLSSQQKAQARTNIAAVSYDQQSLNAEQQVQAQNNVMGKAYSSTASDHSGFGKVYLQKNNGSLTQAMINTANTVYVIQYDYELAENITIPAGCTLEFDGGSISGNGTGNDTISGDNTGIDAGLVKIFNTNINLAGTWNVAETYPEWFGAKGDGVTDDTAAFVAINNINIGVAPFSPKLGDIKLRNKTYVLKSVISIKYNIIGCAESKIIFDGGYFEYSYSRGLDDLITFYSIKFAATENSPRLFDGNPNHYVINKCVFENCYDVFNQMDGEDLWTGNLNFNDCIFRDITNIVISAQSYLNRIGFNNCIFRRVNYILDGSFTCGVEFNNCDLEEIHLWNRLNQNRGINFIGCYIEGAYTSDSDDALIKPAGGTYGIATFENCFINTSGNYIYYEKDDLTVEYSNQRGILKFINCTLFRFDNSFQLFRVGNRPTCFIHIEGIKALIGKWNSTYNTISMYTDVSDIINNTALIIINIRQYQYTRQKYLNITPLPSGTTNDRPKGVGAPNKEGVLDTIACIGFAFFDITLGKPIYVKSIAADGTVTWVDATGTTV